MFSIVIIILLFLTGFNAIANQVEKNSFYSSNSKKKFFEISKIIIEEKNDFIKINLEDSTNFLSHQGKPLTPFIVKNFVFPKDTKIKDVKCVVTDFTDKKIDKKIISASKPVLKLDSDNKKEYMSNVDMSFYSSSDLYPEKWYDYSLTYGLEGVKLSVRIYPVRYISIEDIIRVASGFDLEINYDSYLKKKFFSEEYDMVIIAPDCFSSILQRLVNHKNSIDVDTFFKSTDDIYKQYSGRDNPEKIKYFIKDAIDSYNISYVLLVGGMKGFLKEWYVPVRETNLDDGWESGYISDLYYADVYKINQTSFEKEFDDWDSNDDDVFAEWKVKSRYPEDIIDFEPDVHIGRLACRNKREVRTVVDKIINYETKDQIFVKSKKMICVGGDTVSPDEESENIYEGEFMCDIASDYMADIDYDIVKLYVSDNSLRGPFSFIKNLNLGADFVYFNGHGNPYVWSTHLSESKNSKWVNGLNTRQMNLLFNKNRLPVVVVVGCHNSQFNVTPVNIVEGLKKDGLGYFSLKSSDRGDFWHNDWVRKCWSWRFVSLRHGGAIATIGNTGLGYGLDGSDIAYSDLLSLQFFDAISNQNKTTLGEAHSTSISDYVSSFDVNGKDNKIDRKSVDSLVLLGDPSLKIK